MNEWTNAFKVKQINVSIHLFFFFYLLHFQVHNSLNKLNIGKDEGNGIEQSVEWILLSIGRAGKQCLCIIF